MRKNDQISESGFVVSALSRMNPSDKSLCQSIEYDQKKTPSELEKYWPQLVSENAWKEAWGKYGEAECCS